MGGSAKKEASYADVLNAPPNKVAEIIHGELVLSPRPTGEWTAIGVHREDARVRAEPFQAVELDLSILWRDVQL